MGERDFAASQPAVVISLLSLTSCSNLENSQETTHGKMVAASRSLTGDKEGNSISKILLLNVNGYAGSRFDCCNGLSHFIVNRQRGFRLQADNE